MADVFVSYARSDKARVAPLVAAIEKKGWTVWWDPQVSPGQEFDRQIARELKAAMAVLVVWTRHSVESRWVRGEAREGADRGILIPIRFDGAELPIDVRTIHTTDFDDWREDAQGPQAQEVMRALDTMIVRRRELEPSEGTASSQSRNSDRGHTRPSICVLPFANMSGDAEQEYFSDGITEDIITDLSKVSALAVTSRNSAFVLKGRHVDVPKVARELNVDHVLEGSVRKAGGRVRITAQLVSGANNEHVWAERYDRELSDIFALQDEISEAIVKALKLKLLPSERQAIEHRGTTNVEAYNLYLMGRQLYVSGPEGHGRRAAAIVRLCARATEIDANYASAWALMAHSQMIMCQARGMKGDDGLIAAERALALDPRLPEAHAVRARILFDRGQYDAATIEIEIALSQDAESYEAIRSAAYLSYRRQRLDDAIRYWEKATHLMNTDINSPAMLMSCYVAVGDTEGARRSAQIAFARAEKAVAADSSNGAVMAYSAYALATLGEAERAKERMNRALLIDPDDWNMRYNFACVLLIHLKEPDAAMDVLGPVLENEAAAFYLNHIKVDPDFLHLRENPRFTSMIGAAEIRVQSSTSSGSSSGLGE